MKNLCHVRSFPVLRAWSQLPRQVQVLAVVQLATNQVWRKSPKSVIITTRLRGFASNQRNLVTRRALPTQIASPLLHSNALAVVVHNEISQWDRRLKHFSCNREGGLAGNESRMNHWLSPSDKFPATCDLLLTFQNHLRHGEIIGVRQRQMSTRCTQLSEKLTSSSVKSHGGALPG